MPGAVLADTPFDATKLQLHDLLQSSLPVSQDRDIQNRIQANHHLLSTLSPTTLADCVRHTQEMNTLLTSSHLSYTLKICKILDVDDGSLIMRMVNELTNKHT